LAVLVHNALLVTVRDVGEHMIAADLGQSSPADIGLQVLADTALHDVQRAPSVRRVVVENCLCRVVKRQFETARP
jgi:hypothetical protein